jgi:enterochelin esterase-like enzyme
VRWATATQTPFLPAGLTPTPGPTHTPVSPTVTALPCSETRGSLLRQQIETDLLPDPLVYQIYLPPCFESKTDDLPILILLHGVGYTDSQWPDLGIAELADDLIANGDAQPFIILMPLEQDTHLRPYGSEFGLALTQVLMPDIERRYAVCAQRQCRAIGGISRGGNWAVQIGFTHWDLFSIIGAHSTPLFNEDMQALENWLSPIPLSELPSIYLDIGQNDALFRDTLDFHRQLDEHSVIHEWKLNPGGHTNAYWGFHLEEYIRWYTSALAKDHLSVGFRWTTS